VVQLGIATPLTATSLGLETDNDLDARGIDGLLLCDRIVSLIASNEEGM